MSDGTVLDVDDLLSIDVEAEIRKLAQAQLQGAWQLPAEIVRHAIRTGARAVDVELARDLVRVRDEGGTVPASVLDLLARLLDEHAEAPIRHAALRELERLGALAFVALAGLGPRSGRIVARTEAGPRMLELERGQPPRVREYAEPAPSGTLVEIRGARIDVGQARRWLERVARFSPVELTVDAKPLRRGLAGMFRVATLAAPLAGVVGFSRETTGAHVWLLLHGVVVTHVTVTPAPPFEAAVEMAGLAPPDATPAALRAAIEHHLDELLAQVVRALSRLALAHETADAADARDVARLLLEAVRLRRFAPEIARLPLFRGWERDAAARLVPARFDLVGLRRAVDEASGTRSIPALLPDQDPDRFAVGAVVFVLDEAERAMLRDLMGLGFVAPRRRERAGRWRRGWASARRTVADLSRAFAAMLPGHAPLPDAALTADERRFLVVARAALSGQRTRGTPVRDLVLCGGGGSVRRMAGSLRLPRANPEVEACVRAVVRDAGLVYPALLALLDGRALPSAHARVAWIRTRAREA
jgi:hypothetical protein